MKLPKISVITPVFNASDTLEECISSVANQNYPNLEHWFIDGLSTDGSPDIIEKYAKEFSHIKFISEKDEGIYNAMNKGIDLATGEWLYFLGADDVLKAGILTEMIPCLSLCFDFLYGDVIFKYSRILFKGDVAERKNFETVAIPHQGVFTRKSVFSLLGKYETKYRIYADTVFHIRVMGDARIKKMYVDKCVAVFDETGRSSFSIDSKFLHEKPKLLKKYMNVEINRENYYKSVSKYIFNEIYSLNWKDGLKNAFLAALHTGSVRFWILNSGYWMKKRYEDRYK